MFHWACSIEHWDFTSVTLIYAYRYDLLKGQGQQAYYMLVDAKILHRLKPVYGQVSGRKIH